MFIVSAGVAHPVTLASGRVVAAGDKVDKVDPKDQYLIEDGVLVEGKKAAQPKAAPKKEDSK